MRFLDKTFSVCIEVRSGLRLSASFTAKITSGHRNYFAVINLR